MGFGGFLGFLLQILLLVLLVRFLIRLFRGPSPSIAGAGSGMFARAGPAGLGAFAGASGHRRHRRLPSAPPITRRSNVASRYSGRLERP